MFNNDFVESLFNKYSSKSSILTKSSDFDLFAMAEEEVIKLNSKIANAAKYLYIKAFGRKNDRPDEGRPKTAML